jgi:hypothetical protein
LHKDKLPGPMKSIGDAYIRKEFKVHMYSGTCSKVQFEQFLSAWRSYADTISTQESVVGKPLSSEQKRLLNDTQLSQLEELERETTSLGK